MTLEMKQLVAKKGDFVLSIPELRLNAGDVLGVNGPSGSGKSTLLETIAGFQTVEKGKLVRNEQDISLLPPEQREIVLVFQKPYLFSHLTVSENVEFSRRVKGETKVAARVEAARLLNQFQVGDLATRRAHEISGGQAQRVALARAFATDFPIVLLDEPFSALDLKLRAEIKQVVTGLIKSRGGIAVMVSHDPSDLEGFATRVITLDHGAVVCDVTLSS